jgi:hypothetical protein
MSENIAERTRIVTVVNTLQQAAGVRLLIKSLRTFGGALSRAPIWVFSAEREIFSDFEPRQGVRFVPLALPQTVSDYWFAGKVYACAQAEALAPPEIRSLIWLSYDSLILQPPLLLDLPPSHDAALRPVHIQNVGLRATEPVDAFWQGVYEAVGVTEVALTTESFVGQQQLRAYFNSHVLAVNPALGLLQRWFVLFDSLVADEAFQARACEDVPHRIFLHQAVLSTLVAAEIEPARLRILPPEYSYPYHLHERVPAERRALALNDLVTVAYEDYNLAPDRVKGLEVREPLRSWLADHFPLAR